MYADVSENHIPIKPMTQPKLGENELKGLSHYQQELKAKIPEECFQRNPYRAIYLVFFFVINIALILLVVTTDPAWYWKLAAGLVIGQLNAGMAFVAHEALHGSVFKNKLLQDLVGAVGFSPFLVSPTYWRHWHNQLHHGNTQLIYKDPDAFPTLGVYKRSKFMRVIFDLSPGSKHPLSYFYFFYWFSFQALLNQSYMRFKNKMWEKLDQKRVSVEFLPVCLLAAAYLYLVGPANLIWLVILPIAVQNYVILSYICTNHNLSPLTKINDPLKNSLTVTNHPLLEFLHLNFGYHVEHHLFPRVSCKHTKKIHEVLKETYPFEYKSMSKWKALKQLYSTPRLYKNSSELVHPKSLKTYETL